MDKDLISVIIVNWNGRKWLERCLAAITNQTYSTTEVIVVDNASSDDSVKFMKKRFPGVRLLVNDENLGFAGGNNVGFAAAQGQYILLLNNDTWVEKDFLEKFIRVFKDIPEAGCAQSKMVLMDDSSKLDTVGSYWTNSTFLYHCGNGKDASLEAYNKSRQVFSNKGASMLIRREAIEKLGLFDDDFWCYYEETDLCHRLWILGYECWYYPDAVVQHAGGGTSLTFANDFIQFHNFKNKLLSFLKNFQTSTLLYVVPSYLLINIALSFVWLVTGKPRHALALYRSVWWNVRHFKATREKRRHIQQQRQVNDKSIFKLVKRNPRLQYYKHLLQGTIAAYED